MFHLISYAANPINKTEGQQFKPKLVTKQTPSTEPKVNSFNKSRHVYTGSIQCLPSGPLHILQNKPHQQTRSQQFKQHLWLQKQTPSTNQKATFQPDPRTYKANPINKPENNRSNKAEGYRFYFFWEGTHTHTPSQEGWVFKKQTPLTDQKTTVQPERRPTKQTPPTDRKQQFNQNIEPTKQTPSTKQKTTVQTDPTT